MFEDTLLDSSAKRAPVLTGTHWLISFIWAAINFAAGYFYFFPLFATNENGVVEKSALLIMSGAAAVVALGLALILCYVWSDARKNGFNQYVWFAIAFFLPLAGFIIYLIYSAKQTGDWKRATLPIAYMLEVIIVGVLVLIPLIYTQALPKAQLMTFLSAPPPPPPPPPPPAAAPAAPRIVHRISVEDVMRAPTVIPKTIAQVKDDPEPPPTQGVVGGVVGGVPGGSFGGVLGGVIGGAMSSAPPPPPKPQSPKRIRVGGQVELAKIIFRPQPEYPPLAKMARIQGVVRLDAVISKDGTIQDLKVISGHPLLVKAAMDAVSRWRYQPTLLNGDSVEVATEIDVNFTLSE
jgi:periplasmic protein TonB